MKHFIGGFSLAFMVMWLLNANSTTEENYKAYVFGWTLFSFFAGLTAWGLMA